MAKRYRISTRLLREEVLGSCEGDPYVQWEADPELGSQIEIIGVDGRTVRVGWPRQLRSLAWQLNWVADRLEQCDDDIEGVP